MEIFAGVGLPVIFMALREYIICCIIPVLPSSRLYCPRSSFRYYRNVRLPTYRILLRPWHIHHLATSDSLSDWVSDRLWYVSFSQKHSMRSCLEAMALRHFVIRRLTFAAHLESAHPSLNTSRYLRLTAMAMMQMVWSLCITISTLIVTSQTVPLRPWTHWADVHSDWLRVDKLSLVFTPADVERSYAVLWWLIPISTFIFVGFFAFGKEAVDEYTKCIMWVKRRFLPNSSSKGRKYEKHMDGLPVYRFVISFRTRGLSVDISFPHRAHTPKRGPSSALFSTNRTGFSLDEKSSITRPSVDRAASPLNSDSISTMSTDYYSPPPRAHARSSRDRFGSVAGSHGRGVYIPRMQSSAPFPHRPFLTSSPSSSSTSLVSGDSKARRIPPQLLSYNPPPPRRSSTNSTSSSSPLTHAVRMDDIPDLQFQQH